jgi:hypothetical protein
MKLNISKIFFFIVFFSCPMFISDTYAAVGMGMGMGPPCGGPFPPCPIPLDSGVVLLLSAGALYGGIKLYNAFKKNPA